MTANMIEIVARAICTARDVDPDGAYAINSFTDNPSAADRDVACPAWHWFRESARAAIAAMREPIHAAIDKVNPGESDYDDWWAASVKKQIDAALKEP